MNVNCEFKPKIKKEKHFHFACPDVRLFLAWRLPMGVPMGTSVEYFIGKLPVWRGRVDSHTSLLFSLFVISLSYLFFSPRTASPLSDSSHSSYLSCLFFLNLVHFFLCKIYLVQTIGCIIPLFSFDFNICLTRLLWLLWYSNSTRCHMPNLLPIHSFDNSVKVSIPLLYY